jgi:hypothetical protein
MISKSDTVSVGVGKGVQVSVAVGVRVSVGAGIGVLVSAAGSAVTGTGVLHPVTASTESKNTVMEMQGFFIVINSNKFAQ